MRTYPASYISAKDQINFDVRRRPWYNAGIGCPKDVILLMDTSGSLEGFPSRLLKNTAVKFLKEIISDTDFVTAIDVGYTGIIAKLQVSMKILRLIQTRMTPLFFTKFN